MHIYVYDTVAVREVLGSIPGRGGHKNLCGGKEPSDYVSFRRAVKKEQFHTLKPRYKTKNNLKFPNKRFTRWNWISVRSQSIAPSPLRLRKGFPLYATYSPLYDMMKV